MGAHGNYHLIRGLRTPVPKPRTPIQLPITEPLKELMRRWAFALPA